MSVSFWDYGFTSELCLTEILKTPSHGGRTGSRFATNDDVNQSSTNDDVRPEEGHSDAEPHQRESNTGDWVLSESSHRLMSTLVYSR